MITSLKIAVWDHPATREAGVAGSAYSPENALEALLRGEVEAVLAPLECLPLEKPDSWQIDALMPRLDPSARLCGNQPRQAPELLGIPRDASIQVSPPWLAGQLSEWRPDLKLTDLQPLARFVSWFDSAPGDCQRLHPREFIPPPGAGVLAFLALKADLPTRRYLRHRLHHPEISALTNLERLTARLLGGNPGVDCCVYAEKDPSGHYHAWAWFQGRRARVSSSTTHQLSETLVHALNATP